MISSSTNYICLSGSNFTTHTNTKEEFSYKTIEVLRQSGDIYWEAEGDLLHHLPMSVMLCEFLHTSWSML